MTERPFATRADRGRRFWRLGCRSPITKRARSCGSRGDLGRQTRRLLLRALTSLSHPMVGSRPYIRSLIRPRQATVNR